MSDNRYRLPPLARQLARHMVLGHENNIDRIYYDSHDPPIPTMAAGMALTNSDGRKARKDLNERLQAHGVDPNGIVSSGPYQGWHFRKAFDDALEKEGNRAEIEAYSPRSPFQKPRPFGIEIPYPQGVAALMPELDRAGGAIRDKFGRDAAGGYYFDKLQPDEQAALVDAYHNAPGLVGDGMAQAVRDGDYLKAFWEMKENVKDPLNPRRMDEARPFLENHSPVENLFNSDSYTRDVLDKASAEINRAMEGSGDAAGAPVAEVGNLLNSDSLPENLLNMSPEEMRWAKYRY